jgi:hypothetical protein
MSIAKIGDFSLATMIPQGFDSIKADINKAAKSECLKSGK